MLRNDLVLINNYSERIEEAIQEHTLLRPASQYTLVSTRFADDAVAVGAGILPLEALIRTGWTVSP